MWQILRVRCLLFGKRTPAISGARLLMTMMLKGSDSVSVYVRPTSAPLVTREQAANDTERFPEVLKFVKFSSLAWTPDSKGFFYQVCACYMRSRSDPPLITSPYAYSGSQNPKRKRRPRGYPPSAILMQCFTTIVSAPHNVRPGLANGAAAYSHFLFLPDAAEDVLVYYDKDTPKALYGIYFTFDRKYVMLSTHSDTSRVRIFLSTSGVLPFTKSLCDLRGIYSGWLSTIRTLPRKVALLGTN